MSTTEEPTAEPSFDAALARLEAIVERMDRAELPLEEALALFEEGIRLVRLCRERLGETERRIEQLLADGRTIPFEGDEAGDETPSAPEAET